MSGSRTPGRLLREVMGPYHIARRDGHSTLISRGFLRVQDQPRSMIIIDNISSRLAKIQEMHRSQVGGLLANCIGIQPSLILPGGGLQDLVLRMDYPVTFLGGDVNFQQALMISLPGIERPRLTSSLTIAERVAGMLLQESRVMHSYFVGSDLDGDQCRPC